MKNKKGNMGKAVAIGAGVAAAGAAAYMLLGPNGKKNRAKVKAFVKKVKTKVENNKDMMAMAGMAKTMMKQAKGKVKTAVKKGKAVVKKAVKKATKKQ